MSKSRKKICYILPEFREGTDTHFAYLYDFINALSKESEVFLVVEKGNPSQSRFPGVAYIKRLRVRDRKSTRLNSSHSDRSRMPSSA